MNFYFEHYCVYCGERNHEQSRYCRKCSPGIKKKLQEIKQLTRQMSVYVQDEQLKQMLEKASISLKDKFDLKTGKSLTEVATSGILKR